MSRLLMTTLLGVALAACAVAAWAETPPLITYTVEYAGADPDQLVHDAQLAVLHRTVGTFYFSDRVLIARDILDAYLERNMAQFIAGVTVADRQVDQGQCRLRLDIGVFAAALERALEQYRFLFRPRPTPLCFVFLQESLDDARQDVPAIKPLLIEALTDAGMPVSETAILAPDSRVDVAEGGTAARDNPTLAEALTNAERGGVELLFTGQASTTLRTAANQYYDEYYFYDTTLLLRMFRVDTGALLDEVVVSDFGAHPDDAQAREIAARKCIGAALDRLLATYRDQWPREVLNQTDYHLMVLEIGDDELRLLEGALADLAPGARVFRRSHYADVAVLNLVYEDPFARTPTEERRRLVEALRGLDAPQLRIESVEDTRIVARVLR